MFSTTPQQVKARKRHQCTWCGQPILAGDVHDTWRSCDDSWFTNRVHLDCHPALSAYCAESGGEYQAYDNERPSTQQEPPP